MWVWLTRVCNLLILRAWLTRACNSLILSKSSKRLVLQHSTSGLDYIHSYTDIAQTNVPMHAGSTLNHCTETRNFIPSPDVKHISKEDLPTPHFSTSLSLPPFWLRTYILGSVHTSPSTHSLMDTNSNTCLGSS